MHPDFDTPENHLSRYPLPAGPEPDHACPGCEGDGRCHYDDAAPDEPCDWCGGNGVYVRPEATEAERRERHLTLEAALKQLESAALGKAA